MSSLFQDGCCDGHDDDDKKRHRKKCKGCICELLNQLANQRVGTLCSMGHKQKVMIKNKGAAEFVSADGIEPTVFTLQSFDPENCCAVFTFEAMTTTTPVRTVTRTFIEDCRSIAGIACVEDDTTS